VFVQSEASLYDNVARYVFRTEHAHGQLMALAGIPVDGTPKLVAGDIVTADSPPVLKNGWQLFEAGGDPVAAADVAAAVQDAFTQLLTYQAARAVERVGHPDLCCAGGVFLNLTANSAISALPEVGDVYVPSCPHDAGISVGAALLGAVRLEPPAAVRARLSSDFLGCNAEPITLAAAAGRGYRAVAGCTAPDAKPVPGAAATALAAAADALADGAIVARYAGRAEFGPRALGNRSLLSHPVTCYDARTKLNDLKRRQPWRPVAPMVRAEDLDTYFAGPSWSPFMNFNFDARPEHRACLYEAVHADGTARVQTVTAKENPAIWQLLTLLADRGLVPVLINTSFNGPGQPIIDAASDALDYVAHPAVDYLLTEQTLFATPVPGRITVRRPDSVIMAMFGSGADARYVLSDSAGSGQIGRALFLALAEHARAGTDRSSEAVRACLEAGLLVED
jgi:carbamoyltransferase